ncbi:MAG: transposase [Dermatophilaceae bacterium]
MGGFRSWFGTDADCLDCLDCEPPGFGRARMAILADGSATSAHSFVTEHVEPGARVITDGWAGYRGIDTLGYTYEPRSQ